MTYHAHVTAAGAVEFPEELARELQLRPGGSLVIERENGQLVLKTYEQVVQEVQAKFRAMLPAEYVGSLVDELIADRRAEAARENAEHEEWLRTKGR
jgi:AbrB family transcriptional regulator (stage V sporulation protein T)